MKTNTRHAEKGFVLVSALMCMSILLLLGVSATSTSTFENIMAANIALHQESFYQSDGGTEIGVALLKHNINCIEGFAAGTTELYETQPNPSDELRIGVLGTTSSDQAEKLNFWITNNSAAGIDMADLMAEDNEDQLTAKFDFKYPATSTDDEPRTYLKMNGQTEVIAGAALEQMAGYEGKGKSIGSGGAFLSFDILAKNTGNRQTKTGICVAYRVDSIYANSPAGDCSY